MRMDLSSMGNHAGVHTISFKFKRNIDQEKVELLNNYYAEYNKKLSILLNKKYKNWNYEEQNINENDINMIEILQKVKNDNKKNLMQ